MVNLILRNAGERRRLLYVKKNSSIDLMLSKILFSYLFKKEIKLKTFHDTETITTDTTTTTTRAESP